MGLFFAKNTKHYYSKTNFLFLKNRMRREKISMINLQFSLNKLPEKLETFYAQQCIFSTHTRTVHQSKLQDKQRERTFVYKEIFFVLNLSCIHISINKNALELLSFCWGCTAASATFHTSAAFII